MRWQDDPDLVRQPDEDVLATVEVEAHWQKLFDMVELIFVPDGGGMVRKAERAALRGMLWQAKKRVAQDPVGARQYLTDSLCMVVAAMEIEPLDVYPNLKRAPQEPAVAS